MLLIIYSKNESSFSDLFKFNRKFILAERDGMKGSNKAERSLIALQIIFIITSDLSLKKNLFDSKLILSQG